MKKSILFVIDSLSCGGAEKSLVSLLGALDYSQYEVDLQLISLTGMFLKYVPKNVNLLPEPSYIKFCKESAFFQINSFNLPFIARRIITTIKLRILRSNLHESQIYWKSVTRVIERNPNNYDIAIAWGQGTPTYYVADKVDAKKKFSVINAVYDSLGLNREFDKAYYSIYDRILVVSDSLKYSVQKSFPEFSERFEVLHDIINEILIQKMAEEPSPYPEDSSKRILTVGRLVEAKGYDLMLDAAEVLSRNRLNYIWYIVGEGTERKRIVQEIKNRGLQNEIRLLGEQDNPYKYIKNCSIYVQTSKNEGFCLTLAEAKILNKAIVTTNFPAAIGQIEDEKTGLISDMNGEAIASSILRLLNDEKLCSTLQNNLTLTRKGNREEINNLYRLMEK